MVKIKWFLLDRKGEQWAPWSGTYESLRLAKEARDRCNLDYPNLAPFKLYESKTETLEIE